MLDTTIQVKTDHFDGPLGLLLLLVQKEEMDIRKLNLTKITQQYLTYLSQMRDLNFDVAGDYLYLAATLLLLKSKTAITEEEVNRLKENSETDLNITSQAELIKRLEELQHFQKMGEKLWGLPKKGHEIFVKPKINRKTIVNSILVPMEVEKLTEAMVDFIIKEKRKYTIVKRDKLSIKEKLQFLKTYLKEGDKTDFESLLEHDGGPTVDNTVITFISLLELARLKRLTVFQNEGFGPIYVQVVKSLEDFDIESANGFEEEEGNNTPSEEELKDTLDKATLELEQLQVEEKVEIEDATQDEVPPQILH
jgi:segregation and condensation protein A